MSADGPELFLESDVAPIADELDATYDYHTKGVNYIQKSDFWEYIVPGKYGGKGISSINLCNLREEFSKVCTFADEVFIMQGLGSYPIVSFGTDRQKAKYYLRYKGLASFLAEPGKISYRAPGPRPVPLYPL
jgi:acrylyl-CoA reductase (NADH)